MLIKLSEVVKDHRGRAIQIPDESDLTKTRDMVMRDVLETAMAAALQGQASAEDYRRRFNLAVKLAAAGESYELDAWAVNTLKDLVPKAFTLPAISARVLDVLDPLPESK